MQRQRRLKTVKIKHLREFFYEIVDFLTKNNISFWIGGGLAEQIATGTIDDDEDHDIDFHIHSADRLNLERLLKENSYKVREKPWYKIQTYSKVGTDEQAEFIFLNEERGGYMYQAGGQQYKCPRSVFGNKTCKVGSVKVRIPWPIKAYRNKK